MPPRRMISSDTSVPDGAFWLGAGVKPPLPPTSTVSHKTEEYSDLITSQSNPGIENISEARGCVGDDFKVAHHRIVRREIAPDNYWTNCNSSGENRTKRYQGPVGNGGPWDTSVNSEFPDEVYTPAGELEQFGTRAIAAVLPTNPLSGLTVTLGELRSEGIPSLPGIHSWEGRTSLARSAGKDYLSKEFGWDPLLSEIRNFARVSRRHDRLVRDFERGSGRKIHRRFGMPPEVTVTHGSGNGQLLYPSLSLDYFVTTPKYDWTQTITKTRWFEGCFTYYLPPFDPDGSNWERNRQIAAKLYGVGLTPEVVYNLTPWSWALDWVSNAGDVFHNISAFRDNGLVMQYGFVMETVVNRFETRTYNIRSREVEWGSGGYGTPPSSISSIVETITKVRYTATPYGFGLDWNGFTPFQLSILVALGMSLAG